MKDILRIIVIALTCVFGVSVFFIYSSNISDFIASSLKLHIDSGFVGGEIIQTFYDGEEDDDGNGSLEYPSNKRFEKGSLDLISYTVHKPVYEARWQQYPEYWQIDLKYKESGIGTRNIMIYIGANNMDGDNTETLFYGAENVSFNPNYPWTYALWIRDGKTSLFHNQNEIREIQSSLASDGRSISIRIPLEDKELRKVYSSKQTWHYVLTGVYSPFDRGGFSPIEQRKNISRGSVKKTSDYSQLIPKVYDMLDDCFLGCPKQYDQLNSFDLDNYTKAVIYPSVVNMIQDNKSQDEYEILMNTAMELLDKNAETTVKEYCQTNKKLEAIQLFNQNNDKLAKDYFREWLMINPNDEEAMAYYGSCIAIEAGRSNVMTAVKLVNEAYKYLDEAAFLAAGKETEYTVLMNRASVSESVPEGVFHKNITAAIDFCRCAELSDDVGNKAYLYLKAAKAYKVSGDNDSYEILLRKVKELY